jgi:hypothetical protein
MGGRRWTPWTSSRSQVGPRPTPEPPQCPSDLTDEERRACAAARSGRAPVAAAGAVSAVIPTSPTTAGSRLTHPTAPRRLGPRAGSLRFSPWTPSPAAVSDPRDPRAGLEGHGWSGRLRPAGGGLGPRSAAHGSDRDRAPLGQRGEQSASPGSACPRVSTAPTAHWTPGSAGPEDVVTLGPHPVPGAARSGRGPHDGSRDCGQAAMSSTDGPWPEARCSASSDRAHGIGRLAAAQLRPCSAWQRRGRPEQAAFARRAACRRPPVGRAIGSPRCRGSHDGTAVGGRFATRQPVVGRS